MFSFIFSAIGLCPCGQLCCGIKTVAVEMYFFEKIVVQPYLDFY